MNRFIQLSLSLYVCLACAGASASSVFINELHYDNAGFDKGEGVEIAATAGLDLSGFMLLFYNGSNGSVYKDELLSGTVAEQDSGFGTLFFAVSGLQNGAPDGLALVDPSGEVVQFLSYEGSFTASSGAAEGLVSSDIGVFQSGTDVAGRSLQLVGSGSHYSDFSWIVGDASYAQINTDQVFATTAVPVPAALPLLAWALLGFGAVARR